MIIFVFEKVLAWWCGVFRVHDTVIEVSHVVDWLWVGDFGENEAHNADNDDGEDECVEGLECESVTHMLFFWVVCF